MYRFVPFLVYFRFFGFVGSVACISNVEDQLKHGNDTYQQVQLKRKDEIFIVKFSCFHQYEYIIARELAIIEIFKNVVVGRIFSLKPLE